MKKKILLFILSLSLTLVFGAATAGIFGRHARNTPRIRVCRTMPGRRIYGWRYERRVAGYVRRSVCRRVGWRSRLRCRYINVPRYRNVRVRYRVPGRARRNCYWSR